MPRTLDTPEKVALSNKRAGARMVRKAIQKQIETLKTFYTTHSGVMDGTAEGWVIEALTKVEDYIDGMLVRDKNRKGGLWN